MRKSVIAELLATVMRHGDVSSEAPVGAIGSVKRSLQWRLNSGLVRQLPGALDRGVGGQIYLAQASIDADWCDVASSIAVAMTLTRCLL
ncbi:hypothetical protein BURKHO8Y_480107 [Burkholderia sp. 8Y]|nr:hypothetical protein BURKHO8Y_480107 [Burkholderia sp. 8Y]